LCDGVYKLVMNILSSHQAKQLSKILHTRLLESEKVGETKTWIWPF